MTTSNPHPGILLLLLRGYLSLVEHLGVSPNDSEWLPGKGGFMWALMGLVRGEPKSSKVPLVQTTAS